MKFADRYLSKMKTGVRDLQDERVIVTSGEDYSVTANKLMHLQRSKPV
jgi:hypothetical protein